MTYLKLLLIRHAQSEGNLHGKMEGQTSTALSALGRQQAHRLSQTLLPALPERAAPSVSGPSLSGPSLSGPSLPPLFIYSSPLQRAVQTAHVLLQDLRAANYPVQWQRADELKEMHPGIFQGLTWAEATSQYSELCSRLLNSLSWHPIPQAESPTVARRRAEAWLAHLLHTHQPGHTVWLISHAGLIQQMVSAILGCDRTWKIPIHHTAIFEFHLASTQWQTLSEDRYNPEYWKLQRFNDYAHLDELVSDSAGD
ncbi:MAG: histidine phosphatase family protein [Cyanobacteria bacterium J06614_10]